MEDIVVGKPVIVTVNINHELTAPPWHDPMHTLFCKPAAEWTTEENAAWLTQAIQETLGLLVFGPRWQWDCFGG